MRALLLPSLALALLSFPITQRTPGADGPTPVALPKTALLPVTLATEIWNGVPVVRGSLNGSAERFALCTGLNVSTILPTVYTRLSLPATGRRLRIEALDYTADAALAEIQTLQVGTFVANKAEVALFDVFGKLSQSLLQDTPAACLGYSVLGAFQVTFDLAGQTIRLDRPQATLPAGAEVIPIRIRNGRIWVQMRVPGGRPFPALVDTGTIGTLIPRAVAEKLHLKPVRTLNITRSDGKAGRLGFALIPRMQIGRTEIKDARITFLASEVPESEGGFAVIGTDLLRRFRVTINYARQKMAIAPLSSGKSEPGEGKR